MAVAPAAIPSESTAIGSAARSIPASIVPPDDMLYEVVDGQINEKIVGVREGNIATLLSGFIFMFLQQHRLGRVIGETMFLIDAAKNLQRRPDVAFVSKSRWALDRGVPDSAAWDVVPDLAMEVVSPTNSAVEVQAKIEEYFAAGVSRVWVVYPKQKKVHIYASATVIQVLQLGDELDGGELIPGFRLSLATLFEDDAE